MFENFDIWYNNLGSDDDRPFVAACRDREVKNDERWVLVSFTVEEAKKNLRVYSRTNMSSREGVLIRALSFFAQKSHLLLRKSMDI